MPKSLYVLFQPRGFLFTLPDAKPLSEGYCPWHKSMLLVREEEFGFCPICTEGMSARETEKFGGNIYVRVGYRLLDNKIEQTCNVIFQQ